MRIPLTDTCPVSSVASEVATCILTTAFCVSDYVIWVMNRLSEADVSSERRSVTTTTYSVFSTISKVFSEGTAIFVTVTGSNLTMLASQTSEVTKV